MLSRPFIWGDDVAGDAGSIGLGMPLPAGTVTFFFCDFAGATERLEAEGQDVLDEAVARFGGVRLVGQGEGAGIMAAFSRASDALCAALEGQRALTQPLARIALHTAEAQLRDQGNYFGAALSRCARLRAIAEGGQTLLSSTTHDLVADMLPADVALVDLGVHRLGDLGRPEHVYGLAHPDLSPVGAEALRSLDSTPNNLPDQLTSFVGRRRELAELRTALFATRVLTLTGTGGSGKTRLALQTAADVVDQFPDGAWWVELAPLSDPKLVGSALTEALGVRPLPGMTATQAAAAYLASRKALVILDNCEHLLAACAEVVAELVQSTADVVVIATSRAPLSIPGESEWRVPSLSLPPTLSTEPVDALPQSDAVRLFIERAAMTRPNFSVTNTNAPALAEICHELGGIPLAIELAAARIRVLSVEQIAAALTDRFRLLTGGVRGAMPRQQTLRASVDWSYDLLTADERTLLRRLSVFAGTFAFDAVEQVCAGDGIDAYAVLDLLSALVENSLVVVEEHSVVVRYRMLETVRQYGADRLAEAGETAAVRERHVSYFLNLAESMAPGLETSGAQWLDALDVEGPNLAAAVENSGGAGDIPSALRLCGALTLWWLTRARVREGQAAFAHAFGAMAPEQTTEWGRALWGRSLLSAAAGEFEDLEAYAGQAVEIAEELSDKGLLSRSLSAQQTCHLYARPAVARPGFERAVASARDAEDAFALVESTELLATTYLFQADYAGAKEVLATVGHLATEANIGLHARYEIIAGACAHATGDLSSARSAFERAIGAAEPIGAQLFVTLADSQLAAVETELGEGEKALARALGRLERSALAGAGLGIPTLMAQIGTTQLALGQLEPAIGQLGAVIALAGDADILMTTRATLRTAQAQRLMGDPAARESAARCRAMAVGFQNPQLVAQADIELARHAATKGNWTEADALMNAALDVIAQDGYPLDAPGALDAAAEIAAGLDSYGEAARLLGAADRARSEIGTVRQVPEPETWLALERLLRKQLGDDGYDTAYGEAFALSTDDAIAWVRRARGERKRPLGGWESLTPTEQQVADLVAEGLTNPQVAERMFVERSTIKTHLEHIYAKLNVHNRAELAGLAARRAAGA